MPDEAKPQFVWDAEALKLKAEIVKLNAEAEAARLTANAAVLKAEAESDEIRQKTARARIDLEREDWKRRKELLADEFFHVYRFDSDVSASSVDACRKQLTGWERNASDPLRVTIRINSPGGSIFDGFDLIDHIQGMQSRGHVIDTHAYGMAASMGGVLLQIGNTRKMGPSAHVLIHEAQFRTGGKTGDVEDELILVRMLQDRILDLYADRAKTSGAAKPMSRATIRQRWSRRDWWLSAEECLRYGFVDEVG